MNSVELGGRSVRRRETNQERKSKGDGEDEEEEDVEYKGKGNRQRGCVRERKKERGSTRRLRR